MGGTTRNKFEIRDFNMTKFVYSNDFRFQVNRSLLLLIRCEAGTIRKQVFQRLVELNYCNKTFSNFTENYITTTSTTKTTATTVVYFKFETF